MFWVGGKLILDGQLGWQRPRFTVGMLFAFIAYKGQFTGRVSALINYAVELKMLSLHSRALGRYRAWSRPKSDDALPEQRLWRTCPPSIELRRT